MTIEMKVRNIPAQDAHEQDGKVLVQVDIFGKIDNLNCDATIEVWVPNGLDSREQFSQRAKDAAWHFLKFAASHYPD